MISCLLVMMACQHQPSAVERRKAEIRERDSMELLNARKDLRVADSLSAFKIFELEDLKAQFVFEKQEKYQTVGYWVLPTHAGSKERFTFFPEVEEGGKLLLVSINKQRQYSFAEVDLETSDYTTQLPSTFTDAQRQEVAKCYALAKAMLDLSTVQRQQEKLRLKVRFYEEKAARASGTSSATE